MNATQTETRTEETNTVTNLTLLNDAIKNLHDKFHTFIDGTDLFKLKSEELAEVTNELNDLLNCGSAVFNGLLILEARAVFRENTKVKLPENVYTYRNNVDNNVHCVFGNDANMDAFMRKFGDSVKEPKKRKMEPTQNFVFIYRLKTGVPVTSEYTGTMEQYLTNIQQEKDTVLIDAILLD